MGLEQAKNEVRRSEQLSQQGFIAPTKLEDDRLAVVGAQKEVEAANAERHVATHDLEQARAALSAVRQPVGNGARRGFAVNAPVAGRVLRLLQTSEATVAVGTPLLEIGDTRRLEIVAELLTTDALAATPGSRVVIERWGGPATLEGRVRSVEPAAFTKVSALGVEEQRVRVLIDITTPPAQWQALGDGYRVSVRIVTLAEDKAVQVPVSAVFPLPGRHRRRPRRRRRCRRRPCGVPGRRRPRPPGAGHGRRAQRQRGVDPQWPDARPAGDRLPASQRARRRAGRGAQGLIEAGHALTRGAASRCICLSLPPAHSRHPAPPAPRRR